MPAVRAGLTVLAIGLLAWLVGLVGSSLSPDDHGAPIGAGLLQLVGLPVAGVGAVIALCGFVVARRGATRRT